MTKFVPAILAVATLGLGSAAFAQGSTAPTTTPAPGVTQSKPNATAPSGAASGKVMNEADVRQELQKQGYSDIGDLKRKGNKYEAHAMKDGKRVSLDVDATTGKVITR